LEKSCEINHLGGGNTKGGDETLIEKSVSVIKATWGGGPTIFFGGGQKKKGGWLHVGAEGGESQLEICTQRTDKKEMRKKKTCEVVEQRGTYPRGGGGMDVFL